MQILYWIVILVLTYIVHRLNMRISKCEREINQIKVQYEIDTDLINSQLEHPTVKAVRREFKNDIVQIMGVSLDSYIQVHAMLRALNESGLLTEEILAKSKIELHKDTEINYQSIKKELNAAYKKTINEEEE